VASIDEVAPDGTQACVEITSREIFSLSEIIFEVREDEVDGSFVAVALGHAIATQSDSLEELREMVRSAVRCHFGDEIPGPIPNIIRLHFVRDGMKIPRDIGASELIRAQRVLGYESVRKNESYIHLITALDRTYHVMPLNHRPLKTATLLGEVLKSVAQPDRARVDGRGAHPLQAADS
jgi:hypothetical protein